MFRRLLIVLTALLATVVQAQSPGEGVVVITGATVVHPGRAGAPVLQPDATIIIRGQRIEAVLQRVAIELPQGATVIDGRG